MDSMVQIGEFQMTSNKMIVTDPCYELGTECTYILNTAKTGTWRAFVVMKDERPMALIALHSSVPSKNIKNLTFQTKWKNLGVDSGQMCMCDLQFYKQNQEEYDKYCHVTLDTEYRAGIVGFYNSPNPYETKDFSLTKAYACVSQSGYGDGTYKCKTYTQYGMVYGVMVDNMDESINQDLEKALNILEDNPHVTACATIAIQVDNPFVHSSMLANGDFQNSLIMLTYFIETFSKQFNLPIEEVCQILAQHFEQKG